MVGLIRENKGGVMEKYRCSYRMKIKRKIVRCKNICTYKSTATYHFVPMCRMHENKYISECQTV